MAHEITLYRAADSDLIIEPVCFAARETDARAYLDNPGFGGRTLYQCTVSVSDDEVLDIRSGRDSDQLDALTGITGGSPGAVTADYYVMQPGTVEALIARGYRWVRLIDTYPTDAETWVYLYDGSCDDPEMTEA